MSQDKEPNSGAHTEPMASAKKTPVDVRVTNTATLPRDANKNLQVDQTEPSDGTSKMVHPHAFHMLPLHQVNDILHMSADTVLNTNVKNPKTRRQALKDFSQSWPVTSSSKKEDNQVDNVERLAPYRKYDLPDNSQQLLEGMSKLGSDLEFTADELRRSLDYTAWRTLREQGNPMMDETEWRDFLSNESHNVRKFAATLLPASHGNMVSLPPNIFTKLVCQSRALEKLAGGVESGTHSQDEARQIAQVILGLQAISESGPLDTTTDAFEQAMSVFKEIWRPRTGNVHQTHQQILEQNTELLDLLEEMLKTDFLLKPHPSMSKREESKPKARLLRAKPSGHDPLALPEFMVCNHANLRQLHDVVENLVNSHFSTRINNSTLTSVCTKLQLRVAELERMLQSSHHNLAEIARQQYRSSQMAADYAAMMSMQTRSIQNLTMAYTQLQEKHQLLPLVQRQALDDIPQEQVEHLLTLRKTLCARRNNNGQWETIWEHVPEHSPDNETMTQEYLADKVQSALYKQQALLVNNNLSDTAIENLLQRATPDESEACMSASNASSMLMQHRANHLSVAWGAALRLEASQAQKPAMAMQPDLVDALGLHIASGNQGAIAAMADLDQAHEDKQQGPEAARSQSIKLAELQRLTPQLSKQVVKSLPEMRAEVEMLNHLQLPFDSKDSPHLNKVMAQVLSNTFVHAHNRKRKETPVGTSTDVSRKRASIQPSNSSSVTTQKDTFAGMAKKIGNSGFRDNPNRPKRDPSTQKSPVTVKSDPSRVPPIRSASGFWFTPIPKCLGAFELKAPTTKNPNRTGPFVMRKIPDLTSFNSDAQAASSELRAILKVIRDVMLASASSIPFRVEGERHGCYVCSPLSLKGDTDKVSTSTTTYCVFKNIETYVAPKNAAGLLASAPRPTALLNLKLMTNTDGSDNTNGACANFNFDAQSGTNQEDIGDLPPWEGADHSIIIRQDEGIMSTPKITVEVNPMKIGDAFPDYIGKPMHKARIALNFARRISQPRDYVVLRSSLLGSPSLICEGLQDAYADSQWTTQSTEYGRFSCLMFAQLLLAAKYLPDCPYDVATHMQELATCCSATAKQSQQWRDAFSAVLWKPQDIGTDGTTADVRCSSTFPLSVLMELPTGRSNDARQAAAQQLAGYGLGCNEDGNLEAERLTSTIDMIHQLHEKVDEALKLTPHQVYNLVGKGYNMVLHSLLRAVRYQLFLLTKAQTDDGSAGRTDTAGTQVAVEPAQ